MSNYRRARIHGGTYFFTVVAGERREILTLPESRKALRSAIADTRKLLPFTVEAWVLLPEHLHCIWTLPEGDRDFSKRWGMIKARFSKQMRESLEQSRKITVSRKTHRETSLWQRRFWEHIIRDETDFRRHVDYIHYNPVKHGLVGCAKDWPYSTFHGYVAKGVYAEDWGGSETKDSGQGFGE
jgi:putative transposase